MTPAERLIAAADLLDKRASEATPELALDDMESGLFPEDIAYIAAMHPEVGKGVATCLRGFGMFAAAFTGPDEEVDILGFDDALALADLVLAGESQ